MREITDVTVKICGDSPKYRRRYPHRSHAFQQQSPGDFAGAVLKERRVRRTRRRTTKRKLRDAPRPTSSCDPRAGVKLFAGASSSGMDSSRHESLMSSRRQASVRTKLCTRLLLPLTLLVLLFGVVSFLWIPPRHARRPYSSLADAYSIASEISSHGGTANNYSADQVRRLSSIVGNYNGKLRASFVSSLAGRCYDKGGPNLCSRADVCTKHSLLCKCTCVSTSGIGLPSKAVL